MDSTGTAMPPEKRWVGSLNLPLAQSGRAVGLVAAHDRRPV